MDIQFPVQPTCAVCGKTIDPANEYKIFYGPELGTHSYKKGPNMVMETHKEITGTETGLICHRCVLREGAETMVEPRLVAMQMVSLGGAATLIAFALLLLLLNPQHFEPATQWMVAIILSVLGAVAAFFGFRFRAQIAEQRKGLIAKVDSATSAELEEEMRGRPSFYQIVGDEMLRDLRYPCLDRDSQNKGGHFRREKNSSIRIYYLIRADMRHFFPDEEW